MADHRSNDSSTPTRTPVKTPTMPTRSSPRGKTVKSLAEPLSRAAKIKWSPEKDQVLFDTLLEQVALGRKADNGFKREAYQATAEAVAMHTDIPVNWQNVQNRLRYYKREYIVIKDMLAASGFGWDSDRLVVTAPDEVWEEYLKSHPRATHLRGKRIDRMDDLAVIVGSDQATGRYVQGSTTMATSSSRVQRDLSGAWRDVEEDFEDTIDLSEDHIADSSGGNFSSETPSNERRGTRGTPTWTPDSDSSRGLSAAKKRMRPPRPCDVLGTSLTTVAEAMRDFGLGKEVNRTSKVLDILEEVQGLTNSEFIEVGQILSSDKKLASFFVSLRPERRVEWLKKTLRDKFGNVGVGSV